MAQRLRNTGLRNFDSAPKNGKLVLVSLKKLHTTKKWSLLALIITLMVEWDIKTVLGYLYTKHFFLCEPVSYSANAVLPTPKKVFLQQSNEPSHGPSTASMKTRTVLQVLNCLLCVCVHKCTQVYA